jgi:hypothetical protein
MNKDELETYLQQLDQALLKAFPGPEVMHCLVVGGACLLLAGISDRATKDVDVIVTDLFGMGEASLIYDLDETRAKVRRTIQAVGRAAGLPKKEQMFLNDDFCVIETC